MTEINHTPEPKNAVSVLKQTCDLCLVAVPISQEICTCIEVCGPTCRWMPEEEFAMPAVPRFR